MTEPVNEPPRTRAYRSPVREEQAARTRAAIVAAAGELFVDLGYARTSIRAVAERAGVAADTVYAVFGTKVRLLTAVIDARLAPPGVPNVMDRPEARAVREATDQRTMLQLFARDMAAVSTRVRPVYEVLRTASAVEPDLARVLAEMDGYRLQNMRRLVTWLGGLGPLRLDEDSATTTVWALASPDVGRALCDVEGWTEDRHAEWLADVLIHTLIEPAAPTSMARLEP